MPFTYELNSLEIDSYCFIDENGIEKSINGELIVDNTTNFSFNSNYGQILVDQISQLQHNNKKLIEIEQRYKLFISNLMDTLEKRDRTIGELELKINKNSLNFVKLQQFLKSKLTEMEMYKQKYLREKFLNQNRRQSASATHEDVEYCDIVKDLHGISNGVVIDECHDEI